jgi:autotransporter-associated beta strand protein
LGLGEVTNNATLSFNRSDAITVANDIGGTGALTKLAANTLTLTGDNSYSGITTISAGTLQVGNGGTSGSLGTGNVTNNAALVFNRSDDLNYAKVISGTGSLSKQGAGVMTLSGANTYSGATSIAAGTLVVESDTASLSSSSYSGAGTLVIQPLSTSFSAPITLTSGQLGSLGGLTLGKSGNTARINVNSNTNITGALTIYGPITLGGNITSGGAQAYHGDVTVSGGNRVLSSTNSNVSFSGAVDSDAVSARSLTVTSGSGFTTFTGDVGGVRGLGNITLTGGMDLGGDISSASALTVFGASRLGGTVNTSGTQIYGGAVNLTGDTSLTSSTGSLSFQNTVDGASALSLTVGSTGRVIFNNVVGATTALSAINVGSGGSTYLNADINTTGDQSYANSVFVGVAGVAQFLNGDFSNGLNHWTFSNAPVILGTTVIGGYTTPRDTTSPDGGAHSVLDSQANRGSFAASGVSTMRTGPMLPRVRSVSTRFLGQPRLVE